jgi:DNA-binding NarL/FixJ family response regulator
MKKAIKLLIVDDHTAVRQALSSILKDLDFSTVHEASNGKEAVESLQKIQPDVILMDLDMPVMNGFEALTIIKQNYPSVKVVILSGHSGKGYVTQTLQLGADAFLPKQCSIEVLVEVIENVYNNKPFVYEEAMGSVLPTYEKVEGLDLIKEQRALTPSEIAVLVSICEGKSRQMIADELKITKRTVTFHTENIYKKTLLTNKIALLKYAVKNGYISLSENIVNS